MSASRLMPRPVLPLVQFGVPLTGVWLEAERRMKQLEQCGWELGFTAEGELEFTRYRSGDGEDTCREFATETADLYGNYLAELVALRKRRLHELVFHKPAGHA